MRTAYDPVDYEPADVRAIQLLAQGECPPELQKRALKWIIEVAAATYDQSYMGNANDTIFREGRRFVGNSVVKMLKLKASALTNEPSEQG